MFHAVLSRFAAEGDAAAVYENMRYRLIVYFRLSLPLQAETLADTVLDRLGKRLGEGVVVDSVPGYVLGIARLVLLEAQAQAVRQQRALRLEQAAADSLESGMNDDTSEQQLHDVLEACLQRLDATGRDLILEYYGADGASRIQVRQNLAKRLGITTHALRNRALRLRMQLETCLHARLSAISRDGMTQMHI